MSWQPRDRIEELLVVWGATVILVSIGLVALIVLFYWSLGE